MVLGGHRASVERFLWCSLVLVAVGKKYRPISSKIRFTLNRRKDYGCKCKYQDREYL